jgi:hypothetical protein
MPLLSSNWKLTFDPASAALVLLDYTQLIAGEPRWSVAKGLEQVALPGGNAPFLRPSGNTVFQVSFETYQDETLDRIARVRVMTSLMEVADLERKPLRVQISEQTDRYYQFASAYVTQHDPGRYIESSKARMFKGWTIVATGLSQVGP